jgi:hypothetical protein
MHNPDALPHTLTAYAALVEHAHIDDAVDALVERIGWDAAFLTLAAMDEVRASMGLYSLVCGLFITEGDTAA